MITIIISVLSHFSGKMYLLRGDVMPAQHADAHTHIVDYMFLFIQTD